MAGGVNSGSPLIVDYLKHLRRRNLSPRSIALYRSILLRADFFAGLVDATADDLACWLDMLPLAPRARYTYISALHGFYRWAVREDLIDGDPTEKLERPKLPRTVPRPIANVDLELALSLAEGRMRAWLTLAAYQGLRCQEIAGLRVDDLLFGHTPPLLVVSAAKGRRERILPLHPDTMLAVQQFRPPRAGFVFCREDRPGSTHPVTPHTVSDRIGMFLRSIGVNATAHQLRHWFGTSVYAESLDLRLTQELLGHADPSTTAGYVKYAQHHAAEVIGRLAARERHPSALLQ